MMTQIGDAVFYESPYRTGTYDAVVTALNDDGTVGIDVFMPGLGCSRKGDLEPVLHLRSVSFGPNGRVKPR